MENLNLSLYTTINGMGGGSGLLYKNGVLYLASDDSFILFVYDKERDLLKKVVLNPNTKRLEQIEKINKPDFESITQVGDIIYIFGSGSTKSRCWMAEVDSNNLQLRELHSLDKLYEKVKKTNKIDAKDFNIEGTILYDDTALFFNRGNGPNKRNGVFKVRNWQNLELTNASYIDIPLPAIGGFSSGFTDAVLVDNLIYFLASAEDTVSSYHDGDILGSAIGILSFPDLNLEDFKIITTKYKLEGIDVLNIKKEKVEFILCEDADDGIAETGIFHLEIDRHRRPITKNT